MGRSFAAAAAPAGLLAGWAFALYPWVLPGQVALAGDAAPPALAGPVPIVLLTGRAVVAPCYVVMPRVPRACPD